MRRAALTVLLLFALTTPAGATTPTSCGAPHPTKTITGTFTTAQVGSFVQLPFEVPAGTAAIRAWYCYDQPPASAVKHTIDFGYYDPSGYRGWSGSGFNKDITVSPRGFDVTTHGYRPGPITPGTWKVELGVAAVVPPDQGDPDGSVDWRVELQLETDPSYATPAYVPAKYDTRPASDKPGWYAGDFHVHTDQSGDAKEAPPAPVFDYAFGKAGLDFVQATDHNTDGGWGEWGRYQAAHPGKLIARNEEITTYRGHVNAPGIRRLADYRTGPIFERAEDGSLKQIRAARPIKDVFAQVHAAGGVTTINHPTIFDAAVPPFAIICRGCSWEYTDAETSYPDVDAIEVETGPQGLKTDGRPGPSPFTPLAIQFYEDALKKAGHPIAAVSGSDSHSGGDSPPDDVTGTPVGSPATMVYARELSERGIADAVRAGHTYVRSFGIASPELSFSAGPAIFGDTVHTGHAAFTAQVRGGDGLTLVVTKNGSTIDTVPISGATFTHSFAADAPATGTDHYGLEVMRGSALEDYGTPIFLTRAPARALTARIARVRVRRHRLVVQCAAAGEGLRACRVRAGRLGAATAPVYRDGTVRVVVRLRRSHRRRVRVTAVALSEADRSVPIRRRIVLRRP